jgi:hypothetical protein
MNISYSSPYAGILSPPAIGNGPASFPKDSIPTNFFGTPEFGNPYGIDMRKAFAYSINYAEELDVAALGEGSAPATAIIPGLYGYNASIVSPYQGATGNGNLTEALYYFEQWPNLMNNGFSITLYYNTGNTERQELCDLIQSAVEGLNSNFTVTVANLDWDTYLTALASQELSTFVIGWLADFPDTHDFALPFYHTAGAFAGLQLYSNATMDSLINQAIQLPDGPARQNLYNQIAELALADVPSVTVLSALGRHFEYDWVQGWYYNPIYPGINFFNMYKFYYVPEANNAAPSQPYSEYLPADVNRDGTVNMKDIAAVARAFGSSYTQPPESKWVFLDDVVVINTVNMKAIAYVARQFGVSSPIGTFGPLVSIKQNDTVSYIPAGTNVLFTATCLAGYGNVADRTIQWYYGTLTSGQNGPATLGPSTSNAATSTFTWSNMPAGEDYVYCTVTDTFTGSIATARATAGLSNTVTATSEWLGYTAH